MRILVKDLDNLLVYLRLLEKLNHEIFRMHGVRTLENEAFSKYRNSTDEFSNDFFKITGFIYDKKNDMMMICKKNGILSLNELKPIYDLCVDLDEVLCSNRKTIDILRLFRNKVQHAPHKIDFNSIGGSSDDFTISFEYENDRYTLESKLLDKTISDINIVFSSMLKEVNKDLDLDTKLLLNRKNKLESMLKPEKYLKYNKVLLDNEKIYLIDLFETR